MMVSKGYGVPRVRGNTPLVGQGIRKRILCPKGGSIPRVLAICASVSTRVCNTHLRKRAKP
jgi:hypothetical protein